MARRPTHALRRRFAPPLNGYIVGRTKTMSWFGVNSLRIEIPEQWLHFSGTGRAYAHSPDCRSGFRFTVWPVTTEEVSSQSVSEEKLTAFIGEGIGPLHGPFARNHSRSIQLVRANEPVRGECQGYPTMSCSGVFMSSGDEVGFAVVALHAPSDLPSSVSGESRHATNVAAAMVVANSLDGPEAATELALSVASSCLRAPAAAAVQPTVAVGRGPRIRSGPRR